MKKRRSCASLSVTWKMIIIYVLITVVCIGILTSFLSANTISAVKDMTRANAEQMMLSTYNSMTAQINDVNIIFTSLQANSTLQSALNDKDPSHASYNVALIEDILSETDVYRTKISGITLYAIDHPDYADCGSDLVFSDSVIQNNYFYDEIVQNALIPKWIANDNNYSSESSITAVKLISDNFTEKPLAVVRIDIDTAQFIASLQNLRLADTGQIFVCTEAMHIINPHKDSFIAQFSHNRELYSLIEKNIAGNADTKLDKENYMLFSYPLEGTDFYLIGALKISELYTKALPLRNTAILTAALLILVTMLLIYYVSSYISKPIVMLANEMDRYTPSSEPHILECSRKDEINKLYRSFNDMQRRIYSLTDELSTSLRIQKKAELKAIQAQVSPHFLYNTLNSISSLAQKHSIDDIEYMTSSLATFFTRALNNGNTFCSIRDELIHIKSYIDIQNVRFSGKFDVRFEIPDDMLGCRIINLTLQPLVENCIVHAFKGKNGKGHIIITGVRENDDIYISVADDGLGANITDINYLNKRVSEAVNFDDHVERYGIHSVNSRIRLYYGSGCGLSYSYNDLGGITATVHITTHSKEDTE